MTDTTSKILRKLNEQASKEGGLPPLLDFYQHLLQVQAGVQKRLASPAAPPDNAAVKTRLAQRQPLADFDTLNLDWGLVQEAFGRICEVFAAYPELFGELPQSLKRDAGRRLTRELVKAWFSGAELPAGRFRGISDTFLRTIVQASLQPFLINHARAYRDLLKQPLLETWRRGYCPLCGGSPDISYLEKEAGARWLVCSRCDTPWLFQRLQCPYCGTQQQDSLAYYTDNSEIYRLYVCEQCKRYLKTIDLRKAGDDVLLPLERLLTAALDRQALEQGYH